MQTVIKKTTPEEWQIQARLYQQKRKDGYRAIATVMIQWEYAKRQDNKHSLTLLFYLRTIRDASSIIYIYIPS
jgi:hypothetical protein